MVGGATPTKRADNSKGTYQDAIHDYLLAAMKFYETYGRDIELRYYVSTGQDEAAQRADAVEIKAAKPFAVMDLAPTALDVFDTEMANAKIVVFGFSTTTQKALAQAPYRWGQSDTQAAATNSTEVLGKQLVGKKAAVRRRRREDEDAEVRRRLHPGHHRPRPDEGQLQEVRRHDRVRRELHRERIHDRRCHERAGAGAGHRDATQGGGCHHGDPLHRRRDDEVAHGERDEAGVVPGVVLHRHRVPGPRAARARLSRPSSPRTRSASRTCHRGSIRIRRRRWSATV